MFLLKWSVSVSYLKNPDNVTLTESAYGNLTLRDNCASVNCTVLFIKWLKSLQGSEKTTCAFNCKGPGLRFFKRPSYEFPSRRYFQS